MKGLIVLLLSLLMFLPGMAITVPQFDNETLHYVISYKWGLIHKDAGEATLSLKRSGQSYKISLTAKTKPWADKIYSVRDTLKSTIRISDFKPLSYEKLTHEKGEFKRDVITYTYSGSASTAIARRHRKDKGGKWKITEKSFSATGEAFDMLSIFYYLRSLDFGTFSGAPVTATIFSGKEKEKITIRSLGVEKIRLKNKTEREAYHLRFNFTRGGGKKSSDNMDVWISTDPSHIPLLLAGKLPVGEIRANLAE